MITIQAWITPGIQPRIVRTMFSRNEPLQPLRRSTARGGRKMAIIASQQPAWVRMLLVSNECRSGKFVTYEDHDCDFVVAK